MKSHDSGAVAIFYHKIDLDGMASGYICKTEFERQNRPVVMVGINYGYSKEELQNGLSEGVKELFCVDFSFTIKDMLWLHQQGYKVTVLDHHESAIKKLSPFYNEGIFKGVLDETKSGTLLCWQYFNGKKAPPWWVLTINDLDLWQFKRKDTRQLALAMSMEDMTIEGFTSSISKPIEQLMSEGKALAKYQQQILKCAASTAFYMQVMGKKILVCTSMRIISSVLGEYLYTNFACDGVALINRNRNGYSVSLRSGPYGSTVNDIAEKFGGGGHPKAAGMFIHSLEEFGEILNDDLVSMR